MEKYLRLGPNFFGTLEFVTYFLLVLPSHFKIFIMGISGSWDIGREQLVKYMTFLGALILEDNVIESHFSETLVIFQIMKLSPKSLKDFFKSLTS